ncbi:MAG TPA: glycerophosphodiester phosphodiesterase family protein [Petrimonas sp.]|uniref:glycerophosphodiester phosphodiesterase family protein n=1 Tax=Petrimonas sp. TaxID=2023866 RepID=UPI0017501E8C|nr:glycerophosphodiester phosphodiesterase family protein [Petrimonas sp.]HHV86185.1 glycerophosphodiester phosphodiesterase family protein [Petrimonas sp.]
MAMIKISDNLFFITSVLLVFLLPLNSCKTKGSEENYIKFKKLKDTHQYFAYKADSSILISGHRGGQELGYPENSIEGFQYVLTQMPAFFEIDPRLTKDSVIVLMHDATLDRTTDATGKLSDYTLAELQSVRLKDYEGNITSARIPTLEEVIKWSKGKTVINLDKKDVPLQMIVELIKKHKAEKYVMLTVHTGAQARYYSDKLPGIMLSVFARNDEEFEDIVISGVPWENMIAYVGQTINDSNRHIVEQLRAKGVRCMVSYAPSLDRLRTAEERESAYKGAINANPDIIESDYPVEIGKVLRK